MRITGSFKELSFLIRLATQMKGEFLYFGPEGDLWMMYDNKRMAYVKTKLDVSHHIAMNLRSFTNLDHAFLRIRKDESFREARQDNLGADFIIVGEEFVQIGMDQTTRILMNTHIEKINMFSPLVDKLESMRFTPEPEETPYLKIDHHLLNRYVTDMKRYFREYRPTWHFHLGGFKENDDETMNVLQVDADGELAIIRSAPKNIAAPMKKFRYSTGWFIPERFQEYTFYLSDSDIRLMLLGARHESILEYRVLLFKEHYVIDAHEADLRFKMWLNRTKNAPVL